MDPDHDIRHPLVWAAVAAAALAAVLVVAIVVPRRTVQQPGSVTVAAGLPHPGIGDLTRGYPFPPGRGGGAGGAAAPTTSIFDPDPVTVPCA